LLDEIEEVDGEKVLLICDTIEMLARQINYKKGIARAFNGRAEYYKNKGDIPKAIDLLRLELVLRKQDNDSLGMGRALNDIGASYSEIYYTDSAIQYYLLNLKLQEEIRNYKNIASAYANIGNLYADLQMHEKGVEYLKKALQTRLEHNDEKGSVYTLNNLAVAFGKWNKPDSAIAYAIQGIEIAKKYNNTFVQGVITGGLAELYKDKGEYQKSIDAAINSIDILTKVNRKPNLVYPLVNLAVVYNILKRPDDALKSLDKGYVIMKELNLMSPLEVYFQEYANAFEQKGNHKEALKWWKEYMVLDDSLFKSENNRILSETETKFQTQKKETEIANQKLVLADQNAQLLKQRLWIGGLFSTIGLMAALFYAYWSRYKRKKKEELDAAVIREQKVGLRAVIDAQEEERKRVAKDLHDGIAQEMVALKLGVNVLEQKIKNRLPDQLIYIQELSQQIESTTKEIRTISHLMMPPVLETKGLAPSLELLCQSTLKNAGVDYQINIEGITDKIEDKVKIGIYRVAQELINNIIKHADANKVLIILSLTGSSLMLKIEDDGKGFNFEEARYNGSMGLLNIISRVSTLGGSIHVQSVQPHGSCSTIQIPMP
jgi:signal transduction histidine kinase